MESNKPMETPLVRNWRKGDATLGKVVEASIYRQLVGSLMYLVKTQPYMCYVVNQLSQVMFNTTKLYWKESKHVLRYLRGTTQFGLWYRQRKGVTFQGFKNAYWVGSTSDKKSTSWCTFSIGSTTIFWYNMKKRSVSLCSVEAENMDVIQASCQFIWMRKILVGLFG